MRTETSHRAPAVPGPAPRHPRRRRYRTVWISDTHLGSRGCKAELLERFLAGLDCERLYLVGDVIDGWALRKSWFWNAHHNRIVQRILRMSAQGVDVTYVCGNHDEFLRRYVGLDFGGVRVVDEAVHVTADGLRLLVLHGDRFDVTIRSAKWLAHLGDRAYRLCLVANDAVARVRRRLGCPYWSLSAYLKQKVKNAVSYVASFESAVLDEARARDFDGAVCGHIHKAELREVDGMLYANDGDWVESCTALVEHPSGELEVLHTATGEEIFASRPRRRRRPATARMDVDLPVPAEVGA